MAMLSLTKLKHPRPYGRGVFLCAYMRQHLPKKPHSSFSREAQSKLQNADFSGIGKSTMGNISIGSYVYFPCKDNVIVTDL